MGHRAEDDKAVLDVVSSQLIEVQLLGWANGLCMDTTIKAQRVVDTGRPSDVPHTTVCEQISDVLLIGEEYVQNALQNHRGYL